MLQNFIFYLLSYLIGSFFFLSYHYHFYFWYLMHCTVASYISQGLNVLYVCCQKSLNSDLIRPDHPYVLLMCFTIIRCIVCLKVFNKFLSFFLFQNYSTISSQIDGILTRIAGYNFCQNIYEMVSIVENIHDYIHVKFG